MSSNPSPAASAKAARRSVCPRGEVNSMAGALSAGYELGVMTEEALENLNPGGRELRMASAV